MKKVIRSFYDKNSKKYRVKRVFSNRTELIYLPKFATIQKADIFAYKKRMER